LGKSISTDELGKYQINKVLLIALVINDESFLKDFNNYGVREVIQSNNLYLSLIKNKTVFDNLH